MTRFALIEYLQEVKLLQDVELLQEHLKILALFNAYSALVDSKLDLRI